MFPKIAISIFHDSTRVIKVSRISRLLKISINLDINSHICIFPFYISVSKVWLKRTSIARILVELHLRDFTNAHLTDM